MLPLAQLEHTNAYQEGRQEGERRMKEAIARIGKKGLSVSQIAESFSLSVEEVQRLLETI